MSEGPFIRDTPQKMCKNDNAGMANSGDPDRTALVVQSGPALLAQSLMFEYT